MKHEEWLEHYQKEIASNKEEIKKLLDTEEMTEDTYPTDAALKIIKLWHWDDVKGWFDFIHSIWHLASWGWDEGEAIDDVTGEKAYCYYLSTAGWSGNESIIHAMKENHSMWGITWVQARRGGHYIFELKEVSDA